MVWTSLWRSLASSDAWKGWSISVHPFTSFLASKAQRALMVFSRGSRKGEMTDSLVRTPRVVCQSSVTSPIWVARGSRILSCVDNTWSVVRASFTSSNFTSMRWVKSFTWLGEMNISAGASMAVLNSGTGPIPMSVFNLLMSKAGARDRFLSAGRISRRVCSS